jgi:phage/plasmid-associated DNA primase
MPSLELWYDENGCPDIDRLMKQVNKNKKTEPKKDEESKKEEPRFSQSDNGKIIKTLLENFDCFTEFSGTYDKWFPIVCGIHNSVENEEEKIVLIHQFSKLTKNNNYDEDDVNKGYEKIKDKDYSGKKKTIASLKKYAKEEDEEKYNKLFDKKKKIKKTIVLPIEPTEPIIPVEYFISSDDLLDAYKTAMVIAITLKVNLVLCKEMWYMLGDDNLWKQQKEPSYYIIKELRKYIDNSNKKVVIQISSLPDGDEKEKLIEMSKEYLKSYSNISKPCFLSVITKYMKTILVDNYFADKLDCKEGHLAFKNGIVNLRTKEFRKGILSTDFITDTIQYDYEPVKDYSFVKDNLKKILNNNEEHLEYFLGIIGYTFIGNPSLEKSVYFMIDKTEGGKGDNGKTFFFDILLNLMPCYVYKTKPSLIEKHNTKIHKQLAKIKGKLLVFMEELPEEKDTNGEIVKELGDGNNIENEIMYGTSEIIKILFKLFALSNFIPKIDPKHSAVYNRYKQISFNSHFDRTGDRIEEDPENLLFIADVKLKDKIIAEYSSQVFNLIIDYASKYYVEGIPNIPAQFIKDTKETQTKNDKFACWFEDNCEKDIGYRVALKVLINESKISEALVKEGMKRLGFKYNKDLSKIGKDQNGKAYKGGYEGIQIRELDDEPETTK